MNMTPAKKLIIALAAICVAITLITTNNMAAIMMIFAARTGTASSGTAVTDTAAQNNAQNNSSNNSYVPDNNSAQPVTPAVTDSTTSSGTPAASGDNKTDATTAKPGTPAAGTTQAANKPSSGVPSTVAEIAEYYKTAITKAKSSAKSVTLTYDGALNYNSVFEAGSLTDIASGLVSSNMKAGEKNDAKQPSDLPPTGANCNLTAADIATATCADKGTYYEISIVMKDASNPVAGTGMGAVITPISQDQITGGVSSVPGISLSNIKLDYYGAKKATGAQQDGNVICRVEKATGNMTYLKVDAPCVLQLDAKIVIKTVEGAKVGIECISEYKIAY